MNWISFAENHFAENSSQKFFGRKLFPWKTFCRKTIDRKKFAEKHIVEKLFIERKLQKIFLSKTLCQTWSSHPQPHPHPSSHPWKDFLCLWPKNINPSWKLSILPQPLTLFYLFLFHFSSTCNLFLLQYLAQSKKIKTWPIKNWEFSDYAYSSYK
jgi:hypothetical protein